MIRTASDIQNSLMRWLNSQDNPQAVMDCREAVNDALKELWGKHAWPWYQGQHAIITTAPVTTGTIEYDASTRRFTLSGATWPEWVEYGTIVVGSAFARVDRKISTTIIEIEDGTQFTANLAAGTSYKLWRAEYPVPNDIRKISYFTNDSNVNHVVQYQTPMEFASRRPGMYGTIPVAFTVQRDRRIMRGLNVVFWPFPGIANTYRCGFLRAPAEVEVWSVTDGKVGTTEDSTTITGDGTSFLDSYAGSLIRIGRDGVNVPTAKVGLYPRLEEALIQEVNSVTSIEARESLGNSVSNRKYEISSIIDIDETIMSSAFMQQCYLLLGNRRNKDAKEMSVINAALMSSVRSAIQKCAVPSQITYAGMGNQTPVNQWFSVGVL